MSLNIDTPSQFPFSTCFLFLQTKTTLKMHEALKLVIFMAICSMYFAMTDAKAMKSGEGMYIVNILFVLNREEGQKNTVCTNGQTSLCNEYPRTPTFIYRGIPYFCSKT